MRHAIEDVEYAEYLFDRFYGIGSCESGGVTRLGYTEVEDEMHRALCALGEEKGYGHFADQVGNTYLYRPQYSMDEPFWLVGSHLDSVIEGGRYDGVAGIIAGLLVMGWAERPTASRASASTLNCTSSRARSWRNTATPWAS